MGAAVSRYVGAEPHEVRGFAHEPRFAEIQVGAGLNTQGGSGVSMDVTEQVPDARLVRRACAGDGPAFGALVDRYMRAAYAVALSVTKGHADAEDAAQEGFMVALERIEECRNADRFAGWLMTIVRNRARNLVRREAVRGTDAVPDGAAAKGPNPEQMAERMELEDGCRELSAACPKCNGRFCCCTTSREEAQGDRRAVGDSVGHGALASPLREEGVTGGTRACPNIGADKMERA